MNGVLIIDKPKDFTSFDVVAVVRRIIKQRKIGHTGTLDPMATGVLPLLLGSAAKAQSIMPDSDKEYVATALLGMTTDTLDITGEVKEKFDSSVTESELKSVINTFLGKQMQLPPMYSAIKKDGVRLYNLARQGIEVEREMREIFIRELELLEFDEQSKTFKIRVLCSKGTYIRSLIDDIGKKLQCGAVMTELRRTMACSYSEKDAISLEDLEKIVENNTIENVLMNIESVFCTYPEVAVSPAQAVRFSNGGALDILRTAIKNSYTDKEIYRVKTREGDFIGLGITDKESQLIKIYKLF